MSNNTETPPSLREFRDNNPDLPAHEVLRQYSNHINEQIGQVALLRTDYPLDIDSN